MKAEKRTEKLKDLRAESLVPGVVYGKEIDSAPIKVGYKDFVKTYQQYGMSMTFKMTLDGKTHQVYFKEVQVDPIRPNRVVHFDVQKISAKDTITAEIPVEITGREKIEGKGLIVEVIYDSIETDFPAGSGISNFTLDVEGLEGNDVLRISDLDLPEGFKPLVDDEEIIVSISYPQEEEEPEELSDEDEEMEVEAIKQKGDDEEEQDTED